MNVKHRRKNKNTSNPHDNKVNYVGEETGSESGEENENFENVAKKGEPFIRYKQNKVSSDLSNDESPQQVEPNINSKLKFQESSQLNENCSYNVNIISDKKPKKNPHICNSQIICSELHNISPKSKKNINENSSQKLNQNFESTQASLFSDEREVTKLTDEQIKENTKLVDRITDYNPHDASEKDIEYSEKEKELERILSQHPVDVKLLREKAGSEGGLIHNRIRRKAWPLILDLDLQNIPPKPSQEELRGHRDYNQVVLDVNRSGRRFPPGMEENVRISYQDQLIDCIMWVLVANRHLYYYQGFHDVVVTFLMIFGEQVTFALLNKLTNTHFRKFMTESMSETSEMLCYLYPIVGRKDPELMSFIERSEAGTVHALSWLITWFAHVLKDLKNIVRMYDFFISCVPIMPIYIGAEIVHLKKSEIMAGDCEMAPVYSVLSSIPRDLPLEEIILNSQKEFALNPPNVIENEARLIAHMSLRDISHRRQMLDRQKLRKSYTKKALISVFAFSITFAIISIGIKYFYFYNSNEGSSSLL